MARIVAVHGIGQQQLGPETLRARWLPNLRDGLQLAGARPVGDQDLECAFYGNLFRRQGTKSLGDPEFDANDVDDGWEQDLLLALWREASAIDEQVPGPDARTKLRTPQLVQRALNAMSNARFFAEVLEKAMIFDLKQVHSYLHDLDIREQVQASVAARITDDTRVLVGHSLGSVVAYEALCAHPEWPVRALVTLGSPLGIRNLIFERLQPKPTGSIGAWPGSVDTWTNIADTGDIVALVKALQPLFSSAVNDIVVHNGAKAHDVTPYLTAEETGYAIAAGLAS